MATYCKGSVSQDGSDKITWMAWPETDGEIVAGTDCTVTMYRVEGDGTETAISGATETDAAPTARNIFNGSMTVSLTAGALYYFYIDITVSAASKYGVIPFFVPVRTA